MQKCLDISFNQYPTDGAVADFLLSGITTILTATFVAAALHDKTAPDPLNHLWNLLSWDPIKGDELNDKVTNPVLNLAIRSFDSLRVGALEVLPGPVDCCFNRLRTCFCGSIAFHPEPVDIPLERTDPLVQPRTLCSGLLQLLLFAVKCA